MHYSLEIRVLEELRKDLGDRAVFKEFERERREAGGMDQKARARRIAELERQVPNYTDTIGRMGLSSPALATALTEAEAELAALTALTAEELPALKMTGRVVGELPKALDRYHALLKDLNLALAKDVDKARGLLPGYFEDGMVKLAPNKKRAALDAVYRIDGRRLQKSLTGQVTIKNGSGGRI